MISKSIRWRNNSNLKGIAEGIQKAPEIVQSKHQSIMIDRLRQELEQNALIEAADDPLHRPTLEE